MAGRIGGRASGHGPGRTCPTVGDGRAGDRGATPAVGQRAGERSISLTRDVSGIAHRAVEPDELEARRRGGQRQLERARCVRNGSHHARIGTADRFPVVIAGANDELRHTGGRRATIRVHGGPTLVVVPVGVDHGRGVAVGEGRPKRLLGHATAGAVEGEAGLVPVGDGAGSRMRRQVVVEPGNLGAGTPA